MFITEVYSSIQGETSFSGLPTTFIRLAGCNLRCSWCDTPHSFGKGNPMSIDSVLALVKEWGYSHVCITGGEPLLQKEVLPLMQQLCDLGYVVSLETGGSLDISLVDPRVHTILDIKCPGSGMSLKNYWNNLAILRPHDEIKFVIKNKEDYDFAVEICERYRLFEQKFTVLFSPVFAEMEAQELVKMILRDKLPVRLNLQVHKFIWSPEKIGV